MQRSSWYQLLAHVSRFLGNKDRIITRRYRNSCRLLPKTTIHKGRGSPCLPMKPCSQVHFSGYSKASFSNSLHRIDSRSLLDCKHIVWIMNLPFFSFLEVHYQFEQNSKLIPDSGLFREGRPDSSPQRNYLL